MIGSWFLLRRNIPSPADLMVFTHTQVSSAMTGLAASRDGVEDAGGGGGGGGDGGAVAVSLIDALQRWADALEAQIDIMKSEVEGVRAANKELTRQASMHG